MNRLRISLALIVILLSLVACGSSTKAVVNGVAPATTQRTGNQDDVKVWVNTNSGVYHCPGTRWYGKTKSGQFMTQREAQAKGYRPAYGAVCG